MHQLLIDSQQAASELGGRLLELRELAVELLLLGGLGAGGGEVGARLVGDVALHLRELRLEGELALP